MASVCVVSHSFARHPRHGAGVGRAAPVPAVRCCPYARRRALAVAVLVLLALTLHAGASLAVRRLVHEPSATVSGPSPGFPVRVHDASPGDTLWDLASQLGPHGDVRVDVATLVELNGSALIVAGQPLWVPRSWEER